MLDTGSVPASEALGICVSDWTMTDAVGQLVEMLMGFVKVVHVHDKTVTHVVLISNSCPFSVIVVVLVSRDSVDCVGKLVNALDIVDPVIDMDAVDVEGVEEMASAPSMASSSSIEGDENIVGCVDEGTAAVVVDSGINTGLGRMPDGDVAAMDDVVVNATVVNATVVNATVSLPVDIAELVVVIDTLLEELMNEHASWALMMLVSKVTAPLSANRPPLDVAPVVTVTEVSARRFPENWVLTPSVAELPTCQKTLQALPPLMTSTVEAKAVVRVDPIWKTQTEFGSP
jgi:hypothetical protein